MVYLNGELQTNPFTLLRRGDFVQLVFSAIYAEAYAAHYNYLFKASNKFSNKFFKKITEDPEWNLNYIFEKKKKMPKLFRRIVYFRQPMPQFLEVDLITFSVFCVYTPINFNYLTQNNYKYYNYYLNRLYN